MENRNLIALINELLKLSQDEGFSNFLRKTQKDQFYKAPENRVNWDLISVYLNHHFIPISPTTEIWKLMVLSKWSNQPITTIINAIYQD